jgi:two-component system, cell cycle sensor histidine kinase and response regulator CckA
MDEKLAEFSVPTGSETILVVHEDERLRLLLGIALESCGYTVLPATGGAEALRAAELHDGSIAMVIADVLMPEMSSSELARRLAARHPYLNVLLLSAGPGEARQEVGSAILRKPVRPSALVAKVHRILHSGAGRGLTPAARPQPEKLGAVQVPARPGAGETIH